MKRTWLSLLLVALMMCTLVGCGSTKESDDDKEVTSEVTTETDDNKVDEDGNDKDTSMDGGAPVGETFDEATTEETTTEEVVPVEVTFTLMSEDGSAVAFEGTVPEGLTLVSGDGTNHIEFSYDENPAVTVYLDGNIDNNVLVVNEDGLNRAMPQYLESNPLSEATETYSNVSGAFSCIYPATNGIPDWTPGAELNHLIYPYDTNGNIDYRTWYCDCHVTNDSEGYAVDPNSDEFGYSLWKVVVLRNDITGEYTSDSFTITVRVDQPEVGSVSDDELATFHDEFCGSKGESFASDIITSFYN